MKLFTVILFLSGHLAFAQEISAFPKGREVFEKLDRGGTKLVLIGDVNHDADSIPIAVARALGEMKSVDGDYNCLFVELDQRIQPALDEFWARPGTSILDYRTPMANLIQSKASDLLFLLLQRQTTDQLMVQSKHLGMKIFAIDIDRSTPGGKEALRAAGIAENSMRGNDSDILDPKAFARKTLEMRNRIMSDGIRRRFIDGSCTKGIAFVGNAHVVTREVGGDRIASLYEILLGMGLRSLVASTFQLNCSTNDMDGGSCAKLTVDLKNHVLFSPVPTQYHDVIDFNILSN